MVKDREKAPNTCSQAIIPPSILIAAVFSGFCCGGAEAPLGDDSLSSFVSTSWAMMKEAEKSASDWVKYRKQVTQVNVNDDPRNIYWKQKTDGCSINLILY